MISSYPYVIISSHHHIIIASWYHIVMSWYNHLLMSSRHEITISSPIIPPCHHVIISWWHYDLIRSSCRHIILWSNHHIITSSYHHIIISSHLHVITSSWDPTIIRSYHHVVTSQPGDTQEAPRRCPDKTQEAPRKHPRGTQETPRGAPGAPRGASADAQRNKLVFQVKCTKNILSYCPKQCKRPFRVDGSDPFLTKSAACAQKLSHGLRDGSTWETPVPYRRQQNPYSHKLFGEKQEHPRLPKKGYLQQARRPHQD